MVINQIKYPITDIINLIRIIGDILNIKLVSPLILRSFSVVKNSALDDYSDRIALIFQLILSVVVKSLKVVHCRSEF